MNASVSFHEEVQLAGWGETHTSGATVTLLRQTQEKNRREFLWECLCHCGGVFKALKHSVMKGKVKSCGCLKRSGPSKRFTTHGHTARGEHGKCSRTYYTWVNMLTKAKVTSASMDPAWRSFTGFLADMGERPAGARLRRRSVRAGFGPSNCFWEMPLTDEEKNLRRLIANREKSKRWSKANRPKVRASRAKWTANNKERARKAAHLGYKRLYAKSSAKYKERARVREMRLQQAAPAWRNSFFIEEAYRLAALRSEVLGGKWHVDHVVPLHSKLVCGLHAETNLSVIPSGENLSKGNRHWPNMP